jgi:hypothetical protein
VALRLLDVIGNERLQRAVPVLLELTLDEVGTAGSAGWVVGDADPFCWGCSVVACRWEASWRRVRWTFWGGVVWRWRCACSRSRPWTDCVWSDLMHRAPALEGI